MKTHIMIDLETLGTRPGSVILALGAVKFSSNGIEDRFYSRIDPRSCVEKGMRIDADTVMWWLKQNDEARLEVVKPGDDLALVLHQFSAWCKDPDIQVWGNGAAADNAWLAEAYEICGVDCPWDFGGDRCYRTMKNLRPDIVMARTGTHHNALADADSQAMHLMEIVEALGLGDEFYHYAKLPVPSEQ